MRTETVKIGRSAMEDEVGQREASGWSVRQIVSVEDGFAFLVVFEREDSSFPGLTTK